MKVRMDIRGLTPGAERAVQAAFDELISTLGAQAMTAIQQGDVIQATGKKFKVIKREWSLDRPDPAIEPSLEIMLQLA